MARRFIRRTGRSRRRSSSRAPMKRMFRKKRFFSKLKKVINKTTKVKGIRKPLNPKPEMKFSNSAIGPLITPIVTGAMTTIWDSNSQVGGVNYIGAPTQGVANNQFIGNQFQAKYCDVRFSLIPTGDTAQIQNIEVVRIIIVRARIPAQDNTNYPALPGNLHLPVDTKNWDLWYDKSFTFTTGFGGGTLGCLVPKPIFMRVLIPCKMDMELKNTRVILPYPIVIAAITMQSGISWVINRVNTKFCYTDK